MARICQLCFGTEAALYGVIILESMFLGMGLRLTVIQGMVLNSLLQTFASSYRVYAVVFGLTMLFTAAHAAVICGLVRGLLTRRNILLIPYCIWKALILVAAVIFTIFIVNQDSTKAVGEKNGPNAASWMHFITGTPDLQFGFALRQLTNSSVLAEAAESGGKSSELMAALQYPDFIPYLTVEIQEAFLAENPAGLHHKSTSSNFLTRNKTKDRLSSSMMKEITRKLYRYQLEIILPVVSVILVLGVWSMIVVLKTDVEVGSYGSGEKRPPYSSAAAYRGENTTHQIHPMNYPALYNLNHQVHYNHEDASNHQQSAVIDNHQFPILSSAASRRLAPELLAAT